MMKKAAGFTLIELVAVIMIVGILAVTAVSRYADQSSFSLRTQQELLISALFQAQQLAMSGRSTEFAILSASQFTVRDPGNITDHYSVAGMIYPQSLPADVTLAPASLVRTYNGLGATNAATITLNAAGDSLQVCIEDSGYARAC